MKNRRGRYVETKTGLKGLVYNDELVSLKKGDKIPVHLFPVDLFTENAGGVVPDKLLCNAETLTVIGFFD